MGGVGRRTRERGEGTGGEPRALHAHDINTGSGFERRVVSSPLTIPDGPRPLSYTHMHYVHIHVRM